MTNKLKYREDFIVTINNTEYQLTCYYQNTSTGFRHLCFLTAICRDGEPNTKDCITKVVYYNRTWESYPYETVLRQALKTIYQAHMLNEVCLAMNTVRRVG